MKWTVLFFHIVIADCWAQSVDERYLSLIESLTRSQNVNDEWYRKNNPDYFKSEANYKKYNEYKAQKYKEALDVRIEIQDTYCKKDKKYCWTDKDLAFHQKEVEFNIKEDQLLMEQFLNKDKANDKALMDFHQDKNKVLCEDYGQYCGVGEKIEVITQASPNIVPTITVPDLAPIVKKISETDYLPNTCRWVTDMPRRIVFGPGCSGKEKLCVGYVVCDQKNGGKFIRMSTCGAPHCGDTHAVSCTKQANYGSSKPVDEANITVSDKLKSALTTQD